MSTDNLEEMQKLGFELGAGGVFFKGDLYIRFGRGNKLPWYAMRKNVTLCAHGDMLNSGRMLKFATPMAAAKAAMARWN